MLGAYMNEIFFLSLQVTHVYLCVNGKENRVLTHNGYQIKTR
jgi:hypothetical protein